MYMTEVTNFENWKNNMKLEKGIYSWHKNKKLEELHPYIDEYIKK